MIGACCRVGALGPGRDCAERHVRINEFKDRWMTRGGCLRPGTVRLALRCGRSFEGKSQSFPLGTFCIPVL